MGPLCKAGGLHGRLPKSQCIKVGFVSRPRTRGGGGGAENALLEGEERNELSGLGLVTLAGQQVGATLHGGGAPPKGPCIT